MPVDLSRRAHPRLATVSCGGNILRDLMLMPPPAPPRLAPPPVYPLAAFYFRVSFRAAAPNADCSFIEVSGIAD